MRSLKTLLVSALLASLALAPLTHAGEIPVTETSPTSPWSIRLRATWLETVDKSSGALGKNVLSVSDKLIPEIDIDYRLSADWSLELVLTVPQEHTVSRKGVGEIGDFKHLPPTLMLKYHPSFACVGDRFQPYVGAGVNFTLILDEDILDGAVKLDRYSVGPAGQIGCDIRLTERWTLNLDVKRVMIRTDVRLLGNKVAEARLDPWLYAVGLGYRF
jgi:outer membrane protein